MQIVINISEKDYKDFKSQTITVGDLLNDIMSGTAILAIKNGTPLESVLEDIKAEIEEQVLESLSDGGDDWFTAEKVNECIDIIDKHMRGTENE